jgi:hypothetical protein
MGNFTNEDIQMFNKLCHRRATNKNSINKKYNCLTQVGLFLANHLLTGYIILEENYTKYIHPCIDEFILSHFSLDKRSIEKRNRDKCIPLAESVIITSEYENNIIREDITKYWNNTIRQSLIKYGNSFSKTISEILIEYYVDIVEIDKIEYVKYYKNIRLYVKNSNDNKSHHFFDTGGSIDFINYFS